MGGAGGILDGRQVAVMHVAYAIAVRWTAEGRFSGLEVVQVSSRMRRTWSMLNRRRVGVFLHDTEAEAREAAGRVNPAQCHVSRGACPTARTTTYVAPKEVA